MGGPKNSNSENQADKGIKTWESNFDRASQAGCNVGNEKLEEGLGRVPSKCVCVCVQKTTQHHHNHHGHVDNNSSTL